MAIENAIETSKNWYETARLAASGGIYSQALYSLEMSVEIAFKAVLISVHVDVPKVHDIRRVIRMHLTGNNLLPKTFLEGLEGFLDTFETLLRMRSMVGYGFEGILDKEQMLKQFETLLSPSGNLISECEMAIRDIEVNKK